MLEAVKNYIQLTKPTIMLLVILTGSTALIVEGSLLVKPLEFFLVLFALYLTGGSANALNQYFERDIDKKMTRTSKRRPLPQHKIDPDKALIFFDCHINHAQRIIEAKAKGFKHLLFDDNPPIHKIFTHMPGIPTAAMLAAKEGIDTPEISWVWNGKEVTEPIDLEEARQASELIKAHHMLTDVGGLTRYGGFAFLTYVQI
jgi:hypothetical protein